MRNFNVFENLEVLANVLQVLNYFENINQTSNDVILKELDKQNETYLKQILIELKELNKHLKREVQDVWYRKSKRNLQI